MNIQYEYKCVAGPTQLVVKSPKDSERAVASYAELINNGATNGWEFYSMESITITQAPGCLGLSGNKEPLFFNMLIFRREK